MVNRSRSVPFYSGCWFDSSLQPYVGWVYFSSSYSVPPRTQIFLLTKKETPILYSISSGLTLWAKFMLSSVCSFLWCCRKLSTSLFHVVAVVVVVLVSSLQFYLHLRYIKWFVGVPLPVIIYSKHEKFPQLVYYKHEKYHQSELILKFFSEREIPVLLFAQPGRFRSFSLRRKQKTVSRSISVSFHTFFRDVVR